MIPRLRAVPSHHMIFFIIVASLMLVGAKAVSFTTEADSQSDTAGDSDGSQVVLCSESESTGDSSATGSTVTPDTITANGNPTAIAHSPFDDPANFIFGEK